MPDLTLKKLGKSGEKVPAVGLGTWQLGGASALEALLEGVRAGARLLDTAEIYGTEELVGRAVSSLAPQEREGLVVATKVWPTHYRPDDMEAAVDRSLRKLGVREVDLLQLHWPNPAIDMCQTVRSLERLVEKGKVRLIGVSNFSVKQLERARACLSRHDLVSDQVEYSPFFRQAERELIPYCEREGLSVLAYSPLGHGWVKKAEASALMKNLSESIPGRTPAQVLLEWLTSKSPVIAIPKASDPSHAVEDVRASERTLTHEELTRVERIIEPYAGMGGIVGTVPRAALEAYFALATLLHL